MIPIFKSKFLIFLQLIFTITIAINNGFCQVIDIASSFIGSELVNHLETQIMEKCIKTTGSELSFIKLNSTEEEFTMCIKTFIENENFSMFNDFFEAQSNNNSFEKFFNKYCPMKINITNCFNKFNKGWHNCLDDEEKQENLLYNLLEIILNHTCDNWKLLEDLIRDNNELTQKCANNMLAMCGDKHFPRQKGSDLINLKDFKFKMNKERCNKLNEIKECFEGESENCKSLSLIKYIKSKWNYLKEGLCKNFISDEERGNSTTNEIVKY